jgi:hypothetical protein
MLRVVVIGPSNPVYNEATAAEAITPGHVVKQNGSAALIKNTLAASSETPVLVAVENSIFGKGIDDAWAIGDRVIYQHLRSGCEFMALVAAAAPAIAYDDPITTAADGTVVKAASAATAIGRAREAVDNSAGGSAVRLRVLVN